GSPQLAVGYRGLPPLQWWVWRPQPGHQLPRRQSGDTRGWHLLTRHPNRYPYLFGCKPRKCRRKFANFLAFSGLTLASSQWRRVRAPPINPTIKHAGLIAGRPPARPSGALDTVLVNHYLTLFEEGADGLLEAALAGAEQAADDFRRAPVADGQGAAGRRQFFQNQRLQGVAARTPRRL